MPSTYEPIATQTLGSAASSITFSSIPNTYTDLVLVASIRTTVNTYNNMNFPTLRFNGNSSAVYSVTEMYTRNDSSSWRTVSGGNSSPNQNELNLGGAATTNFGSNIFSNYVVNFMNYSNTTTNKTFISRGGTGGDLTNMDGTRLNVGLYRSTSAISSFTWTPTNSANFTVGCTFTLYGIKAA